MTRRVGEFPAVELDQQIQLAIFTNMLKLAGSILVEHEADCAIRFAGDGNQLYGDNAIELWAGDAAGVESRLEIVGKPLRNKKSATNFELVTTHPGEDPEVPSRTVRTRLQGDGHGGVLLQKSEAIGSGRPEVLTTAPAKMSALVDMVKVVSGRGALLPLSKQEASPFVGTYESDRNVVARADWAARLAGRLLGVAGDAFTLVIGKTDSDRILKADIDIAVGSKGHIQPINDHPQHSIRLTAYNNAANLQSEFYLGVEPTMMPTVVTKPPGESAYISANAHYVRVVEDERVVTDDTLGQFGRRAWLVSKSVGGPSQVQEPSGREVNANSIVDLADGVVGILN